MTGEEHKARAALLGMCYHDGNGEPFYYKIGSDGIPEVLSILDADTLEPLFESFGDIAGKKLIKFRGDRARRAHDRLFFDFGSGKIP